MAASVDGDIRLSVGLDTSSIESQLKGLGNSLGASLSKSADKSSNTLFERMKSAVKRASQGIAVNIDNSALENTNKQIDKTIAKEQELGKTTQDTSQKIASSTAKEALAREKLQLQIDKQIEKIENLKNKQLDLKYTNMTSKEYQGVTKELDKVSTRSVQVQKEIERIQERIRTLIAITSGIRGEKGGIYGVELAELEAKLPKLIREAEQLERLGSTLAHEQDVLRESGKGPLKGADSAQYAKLGNDIRLAERELELLQAKQAQIGQTGEQANEKISNSARKAATKTHHYFGKAFDKIKNLGSKMVNGIKGFFNKIKDRSKDSASSMDKFFKHGFRNILKYALGIRSFYFLFRKIRSAAKEALTAMATQFPEVNAQLSELKNSFIQLKGSVGTLVQPLLQALAPALTTIINLFSEALSVVGSFFALLTGQKFIYKAKKGVSSFAAAQDESTGATKKNTDALEDNQKQLGNYDKLNIIDQQRDKAGAGGGGGGAGGGAGEMTFEKVPIDSQVKDFMDRFKDAWKKGDLTEIGTIIGTKLRDALNKIPWNKIQTKAEQVGKNLGTLIAGFITVPGLAKSIGNTIGQALNTLLNGLQSFIKSVPWQKFGAFLADMLSSVFLAKDKNGRTLIGNIVKTLVDVLNAVIDTFIGFVSRMKGKWSEIGEEISKWLQWAIKNIKIAEFATAIGEFINGLVTLISKVLGKTETWVMVGKKIAQSINNLFHTINWANLAKAISDTAMGFLTMIETALDEVDWAAIGNAVADFLANIDWLGILGKVASIVVKAFWGAIKALFSESNSFGAGVAKAILAALGTIFVAKKFMGLAGIIKGCFGGIFSSGLSEAMGSAGTTSGMASGLSTAIKGVAGKAVLVAAVAGLGLQIGKWIGDTLADDEGPLGDAFRSVVSEVASWFGEDGTMMTDKQYKALQARAQAAKEAVEAELKPITKLLNNANKSLEDSNKNVDAFNKKIANIETGGKAVEDATKTFNELSKKTHLTAVETAALKSASATLAKKYPELNKYMDKNTGILKVSQKQFEKVTNKVKLHKKAIQAQKDAETLYANQAPLKKALEDAQKAYDDAYKKMNDYQKTWKKTYDDWNKGLVDDATMAEANKKMQGYANAVLEAQSSLEKATDAQDANNIALKKAENLINRASIKTEKLEKADATLAGTMDKLNISEDEQRDILADLRKKLDDGTISWKDYKEITGKSYKSAQELRTELGKLDKTHAKPTVKLGIERSQWDKLRKEWQKSYEVRMKVSGYAANEAAKKILAMGGSNIGYNISAGNMYYDSKKHKWIAKATGGIFTGSGWHNIEGYAKGGSPKSGQFFMARENGIPELVGTIKNHTAVMNNGQIVASVASGVYQAVASVAKVILPYVRSQTHAMNWLAQNGLQLPDITIGNILPSNSNFLNALRGTNTTTNNITNGVDYEMLVQAFKEAQTNQPIVVQMPNGKVLAEVVWDEEQKKYKQARSTTLQTRYA